jgi:hypothetical protein
MASPQQPRTCFCCTKTARGYKMYHASGIQTVTNQIWLLNTFRRNVWPVVNGRQQSTKPRGENQFNAHNQIEGLTGKSGNGYGSHRSHSKDRGKPPDRGSVIFRSSGPEAKASPQQSRACFCCTKTARGYKMYHASGIQTVTNQIWLLNTFRRNVWSVANGRRQSTKPRGENQINAHNQIEGFSGKPFNESHHPKANSRIPLSTSGISLRGFLKFLAGGSRVANRWCYRPGVPAGTRQIWLTTWNTYPSTLAKTPSQAYFLVNPPFNTHIRSIGPSVHRFT